MVTMNRRIVATLVAAALAIVPVAAQQTQTTGVLGGKATDEVKAPYTDYAVQLRDVTSGQVVQTRPLDTLGQFSFTAVGLARPYLVELFNQKERRVVCTEGPYTLTTTAPTKADVSISCGKPPAALWLLLAGAGAAAAVAVAARSVSR
jgi:hypothetical protein